MVICSDKYADEPELASEINQKLDIASELWGWMRLTDADFLNLIQH